MTQSESIGVRGAKVDIRNDATGQVLTRSFPKAPGIPSDIRVDAVNFPGLDLNGATFQSFTVTAYPDTLDLERSEFPVPLYFVRDVEALPPVEIIDAIYRLTEPIHFVDGDTELLANKQVQAFQGSDVCMTRTARTAQAEVGAVPYNVPAGAPEWEYVVTGVFPKRIFDRNLTPTRPDKATPYIMVPVELQFVLAESPARLLSLQVYGADDPKPKQGPPCASTDPSASAPTISASPDPTASLAKSPNPEFTVPR